MPICPGPPGHFALLPVQPTYILNFMAGYSGTPLVKKLGIREAAVLYLYHQPADYFHRIHPVPTTIKVKARLRGPCDFIHIFVTGYEEFQREFVRCQKHLDKEGMLWVSWPKKSSKVSTDLDENKIRNYGLEMGLVDVKVCAVSEIWSGLKFVWRLVDR